MSETEIKPLPCPFCGCTEIIHEKGSHSRFSHYMSCYNCWSQGGYEEGKLEAIKNWNTRPSPIKPPEASGEEKVTDKECLEAIIEDLLHGNNLMELTLSYDNEIGEDYYSFLFKGKYHFGDTPMEAIQEAMKKSL